jgi:hypothetical protein
MAIRPNSPASSEANPTVRFAAGDDATALRGPEGNSLSSETPAPAQPEWFVNGRKVDLPRPPGGAPSVFGDLRSGELAPPPEPESGTDAPPGATRPTVADADVQFAAPPLPERRFMMPVLIAVLVAVGAGGVTAWATGLLDPGVEALKPIARDLDDGVNDLTGMSILSTLLPAWATPPAPEPASVVVETPQPTPAPPPEPAPIPVRIELVNDASGSEFAPLSDPMRDRFLATLFKIKPFVGTRKGTTPRFRFTLFIGGTDVIRAQNDVKGTTSCSLAATEEGSALPATVLKASASHHVTSKPVVVPPAKKKLSKKQRAAHAKQVEAAARAEDQTRRQVARTTVSRCAFELATSFAEKALAADAAKASATTDAAVNGPLPVTGVAPGGAPVSPGALPTTTTTTVGTVTPAAASGTSSPQKDSAAVAP